MIEDGYSAGSVFQDVVLSDYERETLAGLAAGLDDPWLASQLLGIVPAPPKRRFQIPTCSVALALLMLGSAVTLAGCTRWLWGAGLGLALMAAGGALLVAPRIRTRVRPKLRPVAERGQWAQRASRRLSG